MGIFCFLRETQKFYFSKFQGAINAIFKKEEQNFQGQANANFKKQKQKFGHHIKILRCLKLSFFDFCFYLHILPKIKLFENIAEKKKRVVI